MNGHATFRTHHVKKPSVRDGEIVSAARSGSSEAFSKLYALYSPRLYRTIFAITRNSADAEDVLQETFLRVHIALHTFEGRSSFYSWITQIAINAALMTLRKRRAARAEMFLCPHFDDPGAAICFEIADPSPSPEQLCDTDQLRLKLMGAMQNLSPCLRKPIELWLANDYSMKEISRALDISVASVKIRLHRARSRLVATHSLKSCAKVTPHFNGKL